MNGEANFKPGAIRPHQAKGKVNNHDNLKVPNDAKLEIHSVTDLLMWLCTNWYTPSKFICSHLNEGQASDWNRRKQNKCQTIFLTPVTTDSIANSSLWVTVIGSVWSRKNKEGITGQFGGFAGRKGLPTFNPNCIETKSALCCSLMFLRPANNLRLAAGCQEVWGSWEDGWRCLC